MASGGGAEAVVARRAESGDWEASNGETEAGGWAASGCGVEAGGWAAVGGGLLGQDSRTQRTGSG